MNRMAHSFCFVPVGLDLGERHFCMPMWGFHHAFRGSVNLRCIIFYLLFDALLILVELQLARLLLHDRSWRTIFFVNP